MPTTSLNQTTELVQHLSHEMTQKLAVLQTPTTELQTLVQQQMEQNPVLEMEENAISEVSLTEAGLDEESDTLRDEQLQQLAQLNSDWRAAPSTVARSSPEDEERRQFMLDSLTRPATLTESVSGQLHALQLEDETTGDVLRLLGYLNDNGWLTQPLEQIGEAENRPLEKLRSAQRVLLSLEPPGLGALDLRECLMVQLEREQKTETLEYRVLSDCFESLSKRRFEDIATRLDIEVDDAVEAAERIARLNPGPARAFDAAPGAGVSVLPELSIEKAGGRWTVTMHREITPALRISNVYKNMMASSTGEKNVRDFLREHIRKGRFFITCLEQRQETIRKVAQEIVTRQEPFFEQGPAYLKPMTMAEIAAAVGVHETTISRTVGGKFAMTPHGVRELRSFFTSGMATHNGGSVSSRTVEAALQDIVAHEDGAHPFSDGEIAGRLSDRGIRISRRTIVKYRDRLGILPGPLRRSRNGSSHRHARPHEPALAATH